MHLLKHLVIGFASLTASALAAAAAYGEPVAPPSYTIEILGKAAADAVDYNTLDYGLYWFRDKREASKAVGQANAYFDPTRPTVIYIHGWQNGATQAPAPI